MQGFRALWLSLRPPAQGLDGRPRPAWNRLEPNTHTVEEVGGHKGGAGGHNGEELGDIMEKSEDIMDVTYVYTCHRCTRTACTRTRSVHTYTHTHIHTYTPAHQHTSTPAHTQIHTQSTHTDNTRATCERHATPAYQAVVGVPS